MTPQPPPGDRPRDSLGRPLPASADPALVVPGVPELGQITGPDAWDLALAYVADDRPFQAHEVFEARWRIAPPAERAAWRALAQWGAALTHAARGNSLGAGRLAERAEDGLAEAQIVPACIDVAGVLASCRGLRSLPG